MIQNWLVKKHFAVRKLVSSIELSLVNQTQRAELICVIRILDFAFRFVSSIGFRVPFKDCFIEVSLSFKRPFLVKLCDNNVCVFHDH